MAARAPLVSSMTRMPCSPLSRAIRIAIAALPLSVGALGGCATPRAEAISAGERAAISDTLQRMIVAAYDTTKPGDPVARMLSLYPPTGGVVSASGVRVSVSRDSLEAGI